MTSFGDSWQHMELLSISKSHLDQLDPSRVNDEHVIGTDSLANLKVSTAFAAITIEAALNDYLLTHCLFIERPYLQEIFKTLTKKFLRASVPEKIRLLRQNWPDEFPDDLIRDVNELFRIRNRVTHQSGEFDTANETGSNSQVRNNPLTAADMQHMRRHHEIAMDFLGRFWLPGDRELNSNRENAG